MGVEHNFELFCFLDKFVLYVPQIFNQVSKLWISSLYLLYFLTYSKTCNRTIK